MSEYTVTTNDPVIALICAAAVLVFALLFLYYVWKQQSSGKWKGGSDGDGWCFFDLDDDD